MHQIHDSASCPECNRVVATRVLFRTALPVTGNICIDQFPIDLLERIVGKVEFLHFIGSQVIEKHIGRGDELLQNGLTIGRAQVDTDTFLIAISMLPIVVDGMRLGETCHTLTERLPPVVSLSRWLHMNYLCTPGTHQHSDERHRDSPSHFNNSDSFHFSHDTHSFLNDL